MQKVLHETFSQKSIVIVDEINFCIADQKGGETYELPRMDAEITEYRGGQKHPPSLYQWHERQRKTIVLLPCVSGLPGDRICLRSGFALVVP